MPLDIKVLCVPFKGIPIFQCGILEGYVHPSWKEAMETLAQEMTISERLIERWHENPVDSTGKPCELHEYLGVSWDEYGQAISDPQAFDELVRSRNPEYTSYVSSRANAKIESVQDAYSYLAKAAEDSNSVASHVVSDIEDSLDERMCIFVLGRLNQYSRRHPTDEGRDFDIYHDIRLLKDSYRILLRSLRGDA